MKKLFTLFAATLLSIIGLSAQTVPVQGDVANVEVTATDYYDNDKSMGDVVFEFDVTEAGNYQIYQTLTSKFKNGTQSINMGVYVDDMENAQTVLTDRPDAYGNWSVWTRHCVELGYLEVGHHKVKLDKLCERYKVAQYPATSILKNDRIAEIPAAPAGYEFDLLNPFLAPQTVNFLTFSLIDSNKHYGNGLNAADSYNPTENDYPKAVLVAPLAWKENGTKFPKSDLRYKVKVTEAGYYPVTLKGYFCTTEGTPSANFNVNFACYDANQGGDLVNSKVSTVTFNDLTYEPTADARVKNNEDGLQTTTGHVYLPVGEYYLSLSSSNGKNEFLTLETLEFTGAPKAEMDPCVITVEEGVNGSVSAAEGANPAAVAYGGDITFNITPAEGYMVESILVDGAPIELATTAAQTYTFSGVISNHSISAIFTPIKYTLTLNYDATQVNVSLPDGLDFENLPIGETINITVAPMQACSISRLTVNGEEQQATEGVYNIALNVNSSYTIDVTSARTGCILTATLEGDGLCKFVDNGDWSKDMFNQDFEFSYGNGTPELKVLATNYAEENDHVSHVYQVWLDDVLVVNNGRRVYGDNMQDILRNAGVLINNEELRLEGNGRGLDFWKSDFMFQFNNLKKNHHFRVISYQDATAKYKISVPENLENGTITSTSNLEEVHFLDKVDLNITPNNGCSIETITVDGKNVEVTAPAGQVYTFNEVMGNYSISATFAAQPTCQITVEPTENGTITAVEGDASAVTFGSDFSFNITPAEGYMVGSILVDGQPIELASTDTQIYTFKAVVANHTISATFVPVIYSVTINGDASHVTVITDPADVDLDNLSAGDDLTITLAPALGCEINGVTMNGIAQEANDGVYTIVLNDIDGSYIINIDSKRIGYVLTAQLEGDGECLFVNNDVEGSNMFTNAFIFAANTPELKIRAGQNYNDKKNPEYTDQSHVESVTLDGFLIIDKGRRIYDNLEQTLRDAGILDRNEELQIEGNGYDELFWGGDFMIRFNQLKKNHHFVVESYKDASTKFQINIAENLEHGTITANGDATAVPFFGSLDVNIQPETGYIIDKIFVDDNEVEVTDPAGQVYKFTKLLSSHSISATFAEAENATFKATLSAGENGTITYTPEDTDLDAVAYNTAMTFKVAPAEGYIISSLKVNGEDYDFEGVQGEEVTINQTITAAFSIVATFEKYLPTYTINISDMYDGDIALVGDVRIGNTIEGDEVIDYHNDNSKLVTISNEGGIRNSQIKVKQGQSVKFGVKTREENLITDIIVDGVETTVEFPENKWNDRNWVEFKNIQEDHNVEIKGKRKEFTVNATTNGNGVAEIAYHYNVGGVDYNVNTIGILYNMEVRITPDADSYIKSIKVGGENILSDGATITNQPEKEHSLKFDERFNRWVLTLDHVKEHKDIEVEVAQSEWIIGWKNNAGKSFNEPWVHYYVGSIMRSIKMSNVKPTNEGEAQNAPKFAPSSDLYFARIPSIAERITFSEGGDLRYGLDGKEYTGADLYNEALFDGSDEVTGIEDVTVDNEASAKYYTLDGVLVENPSNGLYIVVRGSKVTKEVVK